MAKYDPLARWLRAQPGPSITVDFGQLDRLVGGLPPSAHNHQAWWANEVGGRHVQARGWLDAGWVVEEVSQAGQWVRFREDSAG